VPIESKAAGLVRCGHLQQRGVGPCCPVLCVRRSDGCLPEIGPIDYYYLTDRYVQRSRHQVTNTHCPSLVVFTESCAGYAQNEAHLSLFVRPPKPLSGGHQRVGAQQHVILDGGCVSDDVCSGEDRLDQLRWRINNIIQLVAFEEPPNCGPLVSSCPSVDAALYLWWGAPGPLEY